MLRGRMGLVNLTQRERAARLVLGALLLTAGWVAHGGDWLPPLRIFALYPLITGAGGWSPIRTLWSLARSDRDHERR